MTAALEGRYRNALRWYPKTWRARNEEVVLGILLDKADDDGRGTPARGELANLRGEALASRFRWIERILPSHVRDRVSAIAFGAGFGIALAAALFSFITVPELYLQPENDNPVTFGPFLSLGIVFYGIWILAFIARAAGLLAVARALLVLTIPAGIVARYVSDQVLFDNVFPSSTFVIVMGMVAVLALIGGADTSVRSLAWMGSSLVVSLAAIAAIMWNAGAFPLTPWGYYFESDFLSDGDALSLVPVILLGCAVLAVGLRRWTWAKVALLTSLPWIALYIGVHSQPRYGYSAWMAPTVGALAIAALVAFRLAGFRLAITRTKVSIEN